MGHGHDHGAADYSSAFAIGVVLNLGFVDRGVNPLRATGPHSLALVADAGHNLSDVLALLLAWEERRCWPGAVRRRGETYGMRRSSILAALVNAIVLLLVAVGAIAWRGGGRRFSEPDSRGGGRPSSEVAVIGMVINNGHGPLVSIQGRQRVT